LPWCGPTGPAHLVDHNQLQGVHVDRHHRGRLPVSRRVGYSRVISRFGGVEDLAAGQPVTSRVSRGCDVLPVVWTDRAGFQPGRPLPGAACARCAPRCVDPGRGSTGCGPAAGCTGGPVRPRVHGCTDVLPAACASRRGSRGRAARHVEDLAGLQRSRGRGGRGCHFLVEAGSVDRRSVAHGKRGNFSWGSTGPDRFPGNARRRRARIRAGYPPTPKNRNKKAHDGSAVYGASGD